MSSDYILRALVRALAYRAVSAVPWWVAAGILLGLLIMSAK